MQRHVEIQQISAEINSSLAGIGSLLDNVRIYQDKVQQEAKDSTDELVRSCSNLKNTVKDIVRAFEEINLDHLEKENQELKARLHKSENKLISASNELLMLRGTQANVQNTLKELAVQIVSLNSENQKLQLQVELLSKENSQKTLQLKRAQMLQQDLQFNQKQIQFVLGQLVSQVDSNGSARKEGQNAVCARQTRLRRHSTSIDQRQIDSVFSMQPFSQNC
jgi:gluconate kinase